jgi:transcriptional regulator GlxA family with amidase domain
VITPYICPDSLTTDVTILFLDGGHASTAVGPLEVFRDAGVLWNLWSEQAPEPRFHVRTASIDGRPVCCDGPYTVQAELTLAEVGATDLVFVPAVGLDVDATIRANGAVIEFLRAQRRAGARIAGACTGVSLLAAAGILDGKLATTHWGVADEYSRRFPKVQWRPDELVTEDDGLYCSGGVHACLDLALYLVEKTCGREVAVQTSRALLIDMPRDCQAGFAVLPTGARHSDETIRRAEDWIRLHCQDDLRMDALARQLGMSSRNFVRRFKTATGLAPMDYLQRLRVRAAKRLLEEEHVTVQEVCSAVGYGDLAFFRDLFRRHTGMTPGQYRKKFSTRTPVE